MSEYEHFDAVDVERGGQGIPVPRYELQKAGANGKRFVAAVYSRAKDALKVVRDGDIIISVIVDEKGRKTIRQCWPEPFTGSTVTARVVVPKVKKKYVPTGQSRGRPRKWTKDVILSYIREHGSTYKTAHGGARFAAERDFGSWAKACLAAGVEPPKRGRPKTIKEAG
jgi:hypothetical protein